MPIDPVAMDALLLRFETARAAATGASSRVQGVGMGKPAQGAAVTGAKLRPKKPSPCATTTSVLAMRLTAAKAARVCITIGRPPIGSYCLGPLVPARLPWPAQGISAKKRVLGTLTLTGWFPF